MSGWNGAGVFTVPYTFVQDAANGIKILASRQDTQWQTVVAGLMNCQTRDGQNKPSANWDFNGFSIQNLGAPVNPADAARLQDITGLPSGEWLSESNPFSFVSATSFKLTGVDLTGRYEVGRRIKVVHNGGATTSYYTVVASSFAVDTTVTINASTLVSPLTAVNYAMLDAANPSSPVFSATSVYSGVGAALTSGVDYTLGGSTQFPATTVVGDIYNEMALGVVTVKYGGLYLVSAFCSIQKSGASTLSVARIQVLLNGAATHGTSPYEFCGYDGNGQASVGFTELVSATAGQTLQVKTSGINFTGTVNGACAIANFVRVR